MGTDGGGNADFVALPTTGANDSGAKRGGGSLASLYCTKLAIDVSPPCCAIDTCRGRGKYRKNTALRPHAERELIIPTIRRTAQKQPKFTSANPPLARAQMVLICCFGRPQEERNSIASLVETVVAPSRAPSKCCWKTACWSAGGNHVSISGERGVLLRQIDRRYCTRHGSSPLLLWVRDLDLQHAKKRGQESASTES
jgi:hypothetical protein